MGYPVVTVKRSGGNSLNIDQSRFKLTPQIPDDSRYANPEFGYIFFLFYFSCLYLKGLDSNGIFRYGSTWALAQNPIMSISSG